MSTARSSEIPSTTRSGWSRAALGILTAFVRGNVILLAVILGLSLLYTLVGFFLVPRIARSQIEDYVTGTLQRKVQLGELRFNPFAFDASVAGLTLTEPDGAPLVACRHLYVNAELASLWRRAVVLKEVELSAPDIQLIVARDGSVNLAKLVPPSPEPPPDAEKSAPPRVHIGRFSVIEGRVGVEDRTRSPAFVAAVRPIRFALTDFKTDLDYRNAYRFAGTTTAGEQLEWSGNFTVQPLGSTGRFRVQGLRLATIDSYLQESLPFRLAGQALFKGSYEFKLEPLALDLMLPLVAVRDVTLTGRAPDIGTPVRVSELDVEHMTFSLDKRNVALRRVEVRGAHIDVAREADGTISLSRLFGPQTKPDASVQAAPTPAEPKPSASEWAVRVDTIHLQDAAVIADDRKMSPAVRFELAPINVTVNDWRADPSAKMKVDADVTINKQGVLHTRGDVQLQPLTAALAIELKSFGLPALQPYISQATAMTLHTGELSARTTLALAMPDGQPPKIEVEGQIDVANLRTTDDLLNEDFIKWRDLNVAGISYAQNPARLTIDRIVARQPYARVIISRDQTLNVTKVLNPNAAPTPNVPDDEQTASKPAAVPPAKDATPQMAMRIRSVQIIDGSANFADLSIQPSFATGIQSLNGKITGLSSAPASRAKVALQGKVDKYAPVDITGDVNLLSAAKYTELAMSFRNLELTTFNPYSGKFAGYNISKGKLNTELRYHVEDRKLAAEHHIVVDNLEFGARTESKDAAPIPIKLAVALLKDRNGVIDVNLPVSGTLDDPKFRLGPIIWKAILGLLTKIATAPFAALGALFGGGEELAYIDFPAGSAQLAPAEADKLSKLGKALVERPQLKLNVPMTVTSAEDSDAMARAALAARLPPELAEPPADEAAERKQLKTLEGVYKTMTKAAPEYPPETTADKATAVDSQLAWLQDALLGQLKPDSAALGALGQQRAHAVQEALLSNSGLNPERVFMTAEHSSDASEGGQVRMEMKLE